MAKNTKLATFVVKPSNSNEGLYLEDLELAIDGEDDEGADLALADIRVKVGGVEYDLDEESGLYLINEELPVD
jgi:hypothetical protein